MSINDQWKQDFLGVFTEAKFLYEGGYNYIYIPSCVLPEGCTPTESPLLLCIDPKDGYDSRIYFPKPIACPVLRNWNSNIYLLDSTWYSISWRTQPGLDYLEMLMVNLRAFKK